MRRLAGIAFVCLLTILENISYSHQKEHPRMLVTADNPNPQSLPTLAVWEDDQLSPGRKLTMVSATFPNVPGFTCDSWCYESDVDFVDARALPGGKLRLRHRWKKHPEILLVTVVTPEPGAVEFSAHLEHAEGRDEMPAELPFVNLCWQVRRSPSFASAPDPYPKFVERCFIFTTRGRTFLHETTRRKIPVRPADDPYNNPPWVQMYAAGWLPLPQATPDSWADYSPDQYVTPVIGVVSRDGKYLAALANDSATVMAQAWHDCLHNNPQWLPADAPPAKRRWRLKVYAMEDNPKLLLERVRRDFPNALRDAPESGNRAKGSSTLLLSPAPTPQVIQHQCLQEGEQHQHHTFEHIHRDEETRDPANQQNGNQTHQKVSGINHHPTAKELQRTTDRLPHIARGKGQPALCVPVADERGQQNQ